MIGAQPNETGGTFTTSIHWDGNSVLFISDSGGAGDVELRAGELAMMSSVGIDVLDRDMSGAMVADHDSTGFSAWSASTTYSTGGETCKQAFSGDCSGTSSILQTGSYPVGFDQGNSHEFLQTHLDGYNDGYGNTFQGVRSQDSNSQQWSTPDAYAGEVDDPMTQKPFMYNRNNPMEYTDPSGYNPAVIAVAAVGCVLGGCEVAGTVALVGLGVVAVAATAVVAYDLAKGRHKENDTGTPASDASPGWGTKDDPRVKKAGWTENPNRTGSFGETDAAGKFKEKLRVDSGQPGETGWKGKDHEHHNGSKKHLPVGSSHPDVPQQ